MNFLSLGIPAEEVSWYLTKKNTFSEIEIEYRLGEGRSRQIIKKAIKDNLLINIQYLIEWSRKKVSENYKKEVLSQIKLPDVEIVHLRRAILGNSYGIKPNTYQINYIAKDNIGLYDDTYKTFNGIVNAEIKDILKKIDTLCWEVIREDLIEKLKIDKNDVPKYLLKKVLIFYKIKSLGVEIANKINDYLSLKKGLDTWFFPKKMSLGDSITQEEESQLKNSFGAVLCVTRDFMEGKTASDEYSAVMNKRKYEDFRIVPIRINCSHGEMPSFIQDICCEEINSIDDPEIEKKLENIFRGLLKIPKQ